MINSGYRKKRIQFPPVKNMTPKRGQPPKDDQDKRGHTVSVYLSPVEKQKVEEARNMEAPDRRVGAYVRDVVIDHAEKLTGTKCKK